MSRATVILFDNLTDATSAVAALQEIGILQDDIIVVSSGSGLNADSRGPEIDREPTRDMLGQPIADTTPTEGDGGETARRYEPGNEAVVGAAAGGAPDGLVGSLRKAGVSEEHAHVYTEGVRRGGTLVSVRADDDRHERAERVLQTYGGVDATTRGAEYRAGGWACPNSGTPQGGHAEPNDREETISDDPAPLSHTLHAPTLSDDPAPLSHLLHIPVLTKE